MTNLTQIEAPAASANSTPKSLKKVPGLKSIDLHEYKPGVYFLVCAGVVVYVGQSLLPRQRIANHIAEGVKQFDSAFIRHVAASELSVMESAYIHNLEPQYNCLMSNGQKLAPLSFDELKRLLPQPIEQTTNFAPLRQITKPLRHQSSLLDGNALLRLPTVMSITGIGKSSIYLMVKEKKFPVPVQLSVRAVAWRASEINAWVESRGSAR